MSSKFTNDAPEILIILAAHPMTMCPMLATLILLRHPRVWGESVHNEKELSRVAYFFRGFGMGRILDAMRMVWAAML